jgi:3-phytase
VGVRCAAFVLLVVLLAACSSSGGDSDEGLQGDTAPTTAETSPPTTTTAPATTTAPTTTAPPLGSSISPEVRPFAETPDLKVGERDQADDTAIHPDGYVIGVSKNGDGGLEVYDLDANRLQWLQLGKTNNVDLRGSTVVSSNRSTEAVDVLSFENGKLSRVRSFPVPFIPYGICLYRDTIVVTANEAEHVEQYSLTGQLLRKLSGIESQSEGCVADEERGVLYIGEEEHGIWKFAADPDASPEGTLVDGLSDHLEEDVEGLTLVGPYLIVSSQGDSTFAVYRDEEYLASFRVSDGEGIDGASATDGIAAHVGLDLLVVHDANNQGGDSSNYKYVRLSDVFVNR